MEIVIFSVVLNQHQAPISDELWELTNHNFTFVELCSQGDPKGGTEDYSKRPYLLRAWESAANYKKAMNLCISARCCIFAGITSLPFEIERMKQNKLSFEMSERWLKKGFFSLFSPRLLKWLFVYHTNGWNRKSLYKLCCSGYCAKDHYNLHTFKNKCYKWGYFTQISDRYQHIHNDNRIFKIMWCARFIKWKHPEMPIKLARKLKNYYENYENSDRYSSFHIDMYGDGELRYKMESLAKKLIVSDYITFHGNIPNHEIRENMRKHDIFVFTSDSSEGWGAVANEAMSEGCVLVASNKIGSVPFLVNNGLNGFIFKNRNINSLFSIVLKIISIGDGLRKISLNGYYTIRDLWSPQVAAQSLVTLINNIENREYNPITSGPGSKI